MSVFFKKTVQHYQNENGHKKTSFSVVKDNHGIIHKINGTGNGNEFHIKETVAKNLTGHKRQYAVQQKYYKIKASNLKKLLENPKKMKESSVSKIKKVSSKKSVKPEVKKVLPKKKSDKKVLPKKKSLTNNT